MSRSSRRRSRNKQAHSVQETKTTASNASLILVAGVMLLVALVRLRVAGAPLERDEGEYAYAGQLILQGIPPYQLAYNMKFPGTYYAYSAIMAVFGQTAWGIHIGLLLVNAASTLLLFFLGRRLLGTFAAGIAAMAFAVLSIDRSIMGAFAHATHFVVLPALAGFIMLLRAIDSQRHWEFMSAGALLGTAVLMKQQAIFFLPLAALLVLWNRNSHAWTFRDKAVRSVLLASGAAVPFLALCGVLAAQGVFAKFWFWTFQYAREYVSQVPLSEAWGNFTYGWKFITRTNLVMWLLAGLGLILLWAVRWTRDTRLILMGLLLASMLAVSPGFFFRPHYFILLLPAAALFIGVAIASIRRAAERVASAQVSRGIAVVVFAAALSVYGAKEAEYLVSLSPRNLSRATYGTNPFIEAVEIAEYISRNTSPSDRIAVLGSEPEIYFYSNRKSATGYIYTYALMEEQPFAQRMQDEMIREIESAHPAYLVFVSVSTSWLARTGNEKILSWANRYTTACYDMVGIADIHSFESTAMQWDAAVGGYQPRSGNTVYTFRRRSTAPCKA